MVVSETHPDFWKVVLDIMSEGIMLVQEGGTIVFVNRAMEAFTGYPREELVGKTCAFLDFDCCPRDHKRPSQGPCPLFRDGRLISTRCSMKRADGTRLTVVKNAQVVRDRAGEPIFAVEVQTDVTSLKRQQEEISELRRLISERYGFHGIIGSSPCMHNLFDLVEKAAASDAPVLIYGESGTGKELVAKAIHKLGKRNSGPFIRVNCAALSETLLESELFGHVKGAYTGADRTTKGRFEAAHTGDIFLDEIGDVPVATQVKLLRVLQEKELERVGDYHSVPVDVRVIAATHRNLRDLIRQNLFREDLYYRLNVIPIYIPPLRDRREDIPLLADHFVRQTAAASGKRITGLDRESMDFLMGYSWPGNVRELMNVIEYAFVVCTDETISLTHLPTMGQSPLASAPELQDEAAKLSEEEDLIAALRKSSGRRGLAARILGVSRQTVWSRMKKFGVTSDGVGEGN